MAMASVRPGTGQPMGEMNTTPLIDVLLVLLIMFVITIPVASHVIEVGLPGKAPPQGIIDPVTNRLAITGDGKALWNGALVSEAELGGILQATAAMKPEPELQVQPDQDASYDQSARTLALIKASQVTRFGFVGNERFGQFDKAPTTP